MLFFDCLTLEELRVALGVRLTVDKRTQSGLRPLVVVVTV